MRLIDIQTATVPAGTAGTSTPTYGDLTAIAWTATDGVRAPQEVGSSYRTPTDCSTCSATFGSGAGTMPMLRALYPPVSSALTGSKPLT
ncbi:hypothetical protein GCM10027403_04600 [Arthrobacter tecti]